MRPVGFALAAFLLGVTVVSGQQPVPPAAPVDPKLDAHLAQWQKNLGDLNNFRFVLELTRTDSVFKTEKGYSGVVLCMKPNYAILRLNNDGDKTGADYEAFICDGKAVFEYNGLAKTITEWKLPKPAANPGGGATDNLMLDLLSGMKAKDAKARFDITLFEESEYYVYLDVKPLNPKDKAEFTQLRMALYGPKTKWPYLPALVKVAKPNGDTEQWKFKEPQTNIPNLAPKDFAAQQIKGWTTREGGNPQVQAAGNAGQPKK